MPEKPARAPNPEPVTYAAAGVDIDAGEEAVRLIKNRVGSTLRPEVVGGIGGFAGMFSMGRSHFSKPLLVASTDGVGTKLMLARQLGIHDTIGIDLVAMSANDVIVQGAEPLLFLDYIVTGKVIPERIDAIVAGVTEGCRQAGCALLGGEIAEHPGHFDPDDYDLAGFCVGAVEEGQQVTGAAISAGDAVIGIASSGIHSNGYSLVRRLIADHGVSLDDRPDGLSGPLGETLLRPTVVYWKAVQPLLAEPRAHGLAHITGGGLASNVARVVPDGVQVVIGRDTWEVPAIFAYLGSLGVAESEMFRTFNMGLGMVAIVDAAGASGALKLIEEAGYEAWELGEVRSRAPGGEPVLIV